MDAYEIFDAKHEQYPDDREDADRWAFEKEHRDACPMDMLIVVPGMKDGGFMACCRTCYDKVRQSEKASIVRTTENRLAA